MGSVGNTMPLLLYSWERKRPINHCVGGWMGTKAGLDEYEKFPPPNGFCP